MDSNAQADVITTLQACGEGLVLAKIIYQKPSEDWVTDRLVAPYNFSHSSDALIVQCWQMSPTLDDPCWRSFRTDRIVSAQPTITAFTPRQPVTLHTGETKRYVFGAGPQSVAKSEPSPAQLYSQKLESSLRNLKLTTPESNALKKLAVGLSAEEIRAAHGRLYAGVLAEVCADGRVTEDEADRLTALRVWMTELGWCP